MARRPGAPTRSGRPSPSPRSRRSGAQRSGTQRSRATGGARSARAAGLPEEDGPVWGLTKRSLILAVVVVIALITLLSPLDRYIEQQRELSSLRAEVAEQQSEVSQLREDVDRWDDPAYVQAQARERLLFAMPGETQYRLTDSSGSAPPQSEAEQAAAEASKPEWFASLWTSVEASSSLTSSPDAADGTGEGSGGTGTSGSDTSSSDSTAGDGQ